MTQDLQDEIKNLIKNTQLAMIQAGYEDVRYSTKVFLNDNPETNLESLKNDVENWKTSPTGKRFLPKVTPTEELIKPKKVTAKDLSKGLKEGSIKVKIS